MAPTKTSGRVFDHQFQVMVDPVEDDEPVGPCHGGADLLVTVTIQVGQPDVVDRAPAVAEIDAALAAAEAAPWPPASEAYADIQNVGAGQWR